MTPEQIILSSPFFNEDNIAAREVLFDLYVQAIPELNTTP